ncbi:SpoIIE family protein phosphatase [Arenimonas terrae]|uniref:HAMP domain-containing protein n=1 Tax=Arenimonas terrae TaxID=2546226 RepID=A0A5C4RXK7_9GAMM|nr:SpoIIE family protein phosphatase [Arenimonas terrae]TNJ35712.1 HAMP domain-containing protein [Arenimonas terrae]
MNQSVPPTELVVPWRDSLRTRLMLWFGTLVTALLIAGFGVAYVVAQQRIVGEAEVRTRFEARQASERLAAAMGSVRITGEGLVGLFNGLGLQRDGLVQALNAMLEADASAVGGLVALEPGVLDDGQAMAYYAGVERRGSVDRDLVAEGYDAHAQEWYRRTLAATHPWWSEPYFNETAGGVWMVTLNLPLRDGQGKTVGMVSLDVPVRRLSELLDSMRQVAGQRPALMTPGGTLAVHPDPGIALNHTFASLMRESGRVDLAPVEAARLAGTPLELTHTLPTGETRFSVLTPVVDTGWTLQLSLSHEVILQDLRQLGRWLAVGAGLATVVLAVLVRRLARRITVPLSELTSSAGHFAAGEFEWPVPHDTRGDEVGVMARALERARDSIRGQLAEIAGMARDRQKLESELDIAREIQQAMLPPGRSYDGLGLRADVHAMLQPAKAVGGDFYNHFDQGDGRLWFLIGDVSDKGIPAALFMARTMTVLEVAAQMAGTPALALSEAARHLVEGNDTCMFATVLCGHIDLGNGQFVLASAGHDPPVRLGADGSRSLLRFEGGGPLGFEADGMFSEWSGRLGVGDTLLLYTDGVTEAFDPDDQAFGEQRLLDALVPGHSARQQCEALVAAAHAFAGRAPQSDDITVLALKLVRR